MIKKLNKLCKVYYIDFVHLQLSILAGLDKLSTARIKIDIKPFYGLILYHDKGPYHTLEQL